MTSSKSVKIVMGSVAAVAAAFTLVLVPRPGDPAPISMDALPVAVTEPSSIEAVGKGDLLPVAPAAAGHAETTMLAPSPLAGRKIDPVAAPGETLGESTLLEMLHDLAASDPPESLRLARKALNAFPNSTHAPEFEWNVVKSFFNMGQIEDAKAEARRMLQTFPDSDFSSDVERHLLNTPPNP
jgi:hypothetical protein